VIRASVVLVDTGQVSDEAPPAGTAIVRPLRHVRAVRERCLERFASPTEAAASRSARAWAWALGEYATSPVSDQQTAAPPTRSDIEAEIAEADRRRLSGSRENRADAAATVLRWLIGHDDHVPIRGSGTGPLVGGFGDVVRSREQAAEVLALAFVGPRPDGRQSLDAYDGAVAHWPAQHDASYARGVAATLAWVLGDWDEAPISRKRARELSTRDLKVERVQAEDLVEQPRGSWTSSPPPPEFCEGVKITIAWLLGDSTVPPLKRPTGQ
jgi:hypothetical protein